MMFRMILIKNIFVTSTDDTKDTDEMPNGVGGVVLPDKGGMCGKPFLTIIFNCYNFIVTHYYPFFHFYSACKLSTVSLHI